MRTNSSNQVLCRARRNTTK